MARYCSAMKALSAWDRDVEDGRSSPFARLEQAPDTVRIAALAVAENTQQRA